MAAQGSVIYWTSIHRRHHSFSDKLGDPHSPEPEANETSNRLRAFIQGHFLWVISHDVPKPSRYAPELLGDPVATQLSKHYWILVLLGIILPAAAGGLLWQEPMGLVYGAYWGGIVRLAIGRQIIWAVNSVSHAFGKRPHITGDKSTNNVWLSIISFGELPITPWHVWLGMAGARSKLPSRRC